MTLLSLNTGRPREIRVNGQTVRTSIWKSPREGRLHVAALNIDGDEQSDLTVHGGTYKAVYCYPSEHYAWWREQLPEMDLPWGVFGENLTTEGLLETEVRIGDVFEIGSARVRVTQPRTPCAKLGAKFGSMGFVRVFASAGRPGFYLSVVQEGMVEAGDAILRLATARERPTVAEVFGEP